MSCNTSAVAESRSLTWKQCLHLRKPQCNVASCVPWCVKHLHFEVAKLPGLSITQRNVYPRDAALVCLGSHNGTFEFAFQLLIASCVVPVVVRIQNVI